MLKSDKIFFKSEFMRNTLLLITSMLSNLSGGLLKKHINDKYENNLFSYQFYNMIVSLTAAIVLLIMIEKTAVSFFTVFLAVIFGIVTLLQQIFNLYALENGPLSYTTVIISMSTLIPTVSGAVFWDEKIVTVQYIGIIFMIISFILSIKNDSADKKTNFKWLIFSFIAFIATGLIGFMQKVHQTSSYKQELDSFLIIAFLVSFVSSLILAIAFRKKRNYNKSTNVNSVVKLLPIFLMVLSGVFVAVNNKFNLYLSGVLDAAVFFPLVNGGGLVLTSVASIIIFKEKPSKIQFLGIVSGIVSVILVCNPFS